MPARYPIRKILAHCRQILSMWALKEEMVLPNLSRQRLQDMSDELDRRISGLAQLEARVIAERLAMNSLANEIADQCARVRQYTRGNYGPDSVEVKLVGLTRTSERKVRRRPAQ